MERETFGTALKGKRESLRVSVVDLAALAGCTPDNLRRIERGQAPSLHLAHRLLCGLGLRLSIGDTASRRRLEIVREDAAAMGEG